MFKINSVREIPDKPAMALLFAGLTIIMGVVVVLWLRGIQVLFPFIIVLFFAVISTRSFRSYSLSYLDIGFALLFFSEIAALLFSNDFSNSLSSLTRYMVLFVLYVFFKIIYQKFNGWPLLSTLFCVVSSILVVITVLSFYSFSSSLSAEGFFELNNFKNLYRPLGKINYGIINNKWATALLLFIPVNLVFLRNQQNKAIKILLVLSLLMNLFCIVVSFSRGVYLSLLVFAVVLNLFSLPYLKFRQLVIFNGIVLLLLSLAILPVRNSFLTTISLHETISQQRSTEGRIKNWNRSLQLILHKPIMGYGQRNFHLASEKSPASEEDISVFIRTDNAILQLLVERGFVGFCSYFIFFLILVGIFLKTIKSPKKSKHEKLELAILFAGVIALLVRELTFSSFFTCDFVIFLAFYLLFGFIPFDIKIKETDVLNKTAVVPISLAILCIFIFVNVKQFLLIHRNNQFVASYLKNDSTDGLDRIDKALSLSSNNVDLLKHKTLAFIPNPLSIEISANLDYLFSIRNADIEAIQLSLEYLQVALEQRPQNGEILHTAGWLYLALDNQEMAEYYFGKSLEQEPYNSSYRISLLLNHLKYLNVRDASGELSKALRYEPDILESKLYLEFAAKYPSFATEARQMAIDGLKNQLNISDNVVLKARLARLILDEDPMKSMQLLEEVIGMLPNLNRPWTYLGYLHSTLGNHARADQYYQTGIFLNRRDFLSKWYYGKYCMSRGMNEKAVGELKNALRFYAPKNLRSYTLMRTMTNMDIIPLSNIMSDLLLNIQPHIDAPAIFEYLGNYYAEQEDAENSGYYYLLSEKYESRVFKGGEHFNY